MREPRSIDKEISMAVTLVERKILGPHLENGLQIINLRTAETQMVAHRSFIHTARNAAALKAVMQEGGNSHENFQIL